MASPDDEPHTIDLREILAVLRRRKWSVVLPALLLVAVAQSFVFTRPALYSSTARVQVLPETVQQALTIGDGASFANMDAESALVTSAGVETGAADILVDGGLDASLATDVDVSVSVPTNTEKMDITCTTERKEWAQPCADAYAEAYVADRSATVEEKIARLRTPIEDRIAGLEIAMDALTTEISATVDPEARAHLEGQLAFLQQDLGMAQETLDQQPEASDAAARVVTPAEPPTSPSNKGYATAGILAAILGLTFGVGLAFIRERMDARVGQHGGLDAILGTPVLAVIPHVGGRRRKGSTVISQADPESAAAEAYRSACTVLLHRAGEHGAKTILVAGPGQGEGRSTTTANLGVALARSGHRVFAVSCDLRTPTLHQLFGLASDPGLADVLQRRISLRDALRRTGVPSLVVLPSGVPPANPSELLASEAMGAVVSRLRASADFVLLDTPPSLAVADALELAPVVDGILVVVDGSTTTQADVSRLRAQLDQVGGLVLGCVLNNLDRTAASRDGSYFGGSYGYSGEGARDGGRTGFDVSPNGNGKAHAPEEAAPEADASR